MLQWRESLSGNGAKLFERDVPGLKETISKLNLEGSRAFPASGPQHRSEKKFFNFQLIFRGISVSFIVRKLKMSTRRVICRKMQRDLDVTVCLLFVTTEFRIRVTGKRRSAGLRQLRHPKWTFDRQISFSALWKCVISVLLTVAGDDMTASGRRSRSGALETDRTAGDLPSPGVPPCRM